ncbi:MAG: DUF1800 domain-containing protein [Anaerolineales bacterium]
MTLSRRDFLKLSALVAGSAALSACGPVYDLLEGQAPFEAKQAWGPLTRLPASDFRALGRMTFGPTISERKRVAQIGLMNWIEEQLDPESLEAFSLSLRLRNLTTLDKSANDLFDISNELFDSFDKQTVPGQLRQATLLRQVYSPRQLYEVMVEFWSDHFNITTEKGDCYYLKTVDDREVIRAHALGNFRDLLWASAHSPAMLVYLDNQANHKGAPNENYARELMELHTLGVDGGYSQNDVMELARCFTGWTVKERFWRGEFTFEDDLHDNGVKTVLGMRIDPAGQAEAEGVIERLALHPSTARYISTKLARRFISDDPPAEAIEKATAAFIQTQGDIRAVLRVILLDGLAGMQPKYKRPVNFVTSALRLLDAETDGGNAVQKYLLRMGQPYFGWPTPDGYPDDNLRWQGNLMPRWQFAFALVQNEIGKTKVNLRELVERIGTQSPTALLDAVSTLLLGVPLEPSQRNTLLSALSGTGASKADMLRIITGGILASPAFQWR